MSERKPPAGTDGLLGDLESIRSLLEEDDQQQPSAPPERGDAESPAPPAEPSTAADRGEGDEEDVPLLEDVVRGGVSVNETFLSGERHFQADSEAAGLDDAVFKALLSDEWRDSARTLLDQARAAIEQHQTEWTPEHTDELNAALRERIDATLQRWLRRAVMENIDDLRRALLAAVSDEIGRTIADQFNQTPDEDPNGE
jgi:hypothetical protein